ncbi:hypothetical protein RRG08_010431 [Elysia crispata]|uniref:Uncharacterized protein n=1 Tax=Elysia crispata TaxID=231223 RepID=A0AAE1DVD3_9GAST|nr:hypothetical protein RRG08_010431 [Elysia crispata]
MMFQSFPRPALASSSGPNLSNESNILRLATPERRLAYTKGISRVDKSSPYSSPSTCRWLLEVVASRQARDRADLSNTCYGIQPGG